jgi:hypothetical protein
MQLSFGQSSFSLLNGGNGASLRGPWLHHRSREEADSVGQFLDEYEEIKWTVVIWYALRDRSGGRQITPASR